MVLQGTPLLLFYVWWLFINACLSYCEYTFLLQFTNVQTGTQARRDRLIYIGVNSSLTFVALSSSMPSFSLELLHIAVICMFCSSFLHCQWTKAVAPAIILFTLSTLLSGLSTILMRLLVTSLSSKALGLVVQLLLSVCLALLFFCALRWIASRFAFTAQQNLSPYLYILLLPCAFMVWLIRFGLGLDQMAQFPSPASAPLMAFSALWTFVLMLGAASTFVVILQVFSKIVAISQQTTQQTLLHETLRQQQRYLAEARKRDEQSRAFQHDIKNHLLVLSGLIHEQNYREAEQYFAKLHLASKALHSPVSTGHAVLDILLGEKIRYAQQNNITITSEIHFPPHLWVDDMDLCIILSNTIDNAIQACASEAEEDRKIQLVAWAKHQFLILEVTNPSHALLPVQFGTGLTNVQQTVNKYQGTLDVIQEHGIFRCSVLLCQSQSTAQPFTKQK